MISDIANYTSSSPGENSEPTSHLYEIHMRNLADASSRFEQSRIETQKRNTRFRLAGLAALAVVSYAGYQMSKGYFQKDTSQNYDKTEQPYLHQTHTSFNR